jgi:hypothetical protein
MGIWQDLVDQHGYPRPARISAAETLADILLHYGSRASINVHSIGATAESGVPFETQALAHGAPQEAWGIGRTQPSVYVFLKVSPIREWMTAATRGQNRPARGRFGYGARGLVTQDSLGAINFQRCREFVNFDSDCLLWTRPKRRIDNVGWPPASRVLLGRRT